MKLKMSRPCYDKPHRCPGWAGGGMRFAKRYRCGNGSVQVRPTVREVKWMIRGGDRRLLEWDSHPGAHPFRFGHCVGRMIDEKGRRSEPCGITTWPYVTRWLDWRYVINWQLRSAWQNWRNR